MRFLNRIFSESKVSPKSKINQIVKKNKSKIQNSSKLELVRLHDNLRKSKWEREKYKNGWKLVIKDSCEVYKDRQKRNGSKSVSENERNGSHSCENVNRKKTGRQKKKRAEVKSKQPPRKPDRKRNSYASSTSASTICSCQCSNYSDMDQE